ncbi:MAG: response regulator transcription factor, partial [Rhodopila sp.]|nr:response regulator transcription factor [Rhodopila sp.]
GRVAGAARRSGASDQRDDRGPSGGMSVTGGLRVRVHTADPVRRRGLAAMLEAAGHVLTDDTPDVELCDLDRMSLPMPKEAEAPVVALTLVSPAGAPAGVLAPDATAEQLDAALRAVFAGLLVRSTAAPDTKGFAPADDMPLLTPREREILGLIGEGLSNKAMARRLGISVHTVKFHLEALFTKLDATSRAEAVAKGLRGGVIEL